MKDFLNRSVGESVVLPVQEEVQRVVGIIHDE